MLLRHWVTPLLAASALLSFAACGDDESPADDANPDASLGVDAAQSDGSTADGSTATDASTTDAAPTSDGGPLPLPGPVTFSSLYAHTCAIQGGAVRCWGFNPGGALGLDPDEEQSAAIVTVSGISDAIEIAAGGQMTCALRADHTVACWGFNNFGQLGLGSDNPNETETPLAVPGLTNVRAIATGYAFACAIRDDRSVVCWGRNQSGVLGQDAGASSNTPVVIEGVTDAERIACGSGEACVIREDRSVVCWKANPPAVVPGLTGVVQVAVGQNHTCALRENGTVACWGANDYGQLGPAATGSTTTPVDVTGLTDVVSIGAGYSHTCAVRANGGVVCWGRNQAGALGNGDEGVPSSATPLAVALTDALEVQGAQLSTCALREGQKASCWGDNNVAQLGAATDAGSSASPVEVVGF